LRMHLIEIMERGIDPQGWEPTQIPVVFGDPKPRSQIREEIVENDNRSMLYGTFLPKPHCGLRPAGLHSANSVCILDSSLFLDRAVLQKVFQ
jgi:hypothetical protein